MTEVPIGDDKTEGIWPEHDDLWLILASIWNRAKAGYDDKEQTINPIYAAMEEICHQSAEKARREGATEFADDVMDNLGTNNFDELMLGHISRWEIRHLLERRLNHGANGVEDDETK